MPFGAFAQGSRAVGFTHDVASGDPDQSSVSLWTRYVGTDPTGTVLQAEISRNLAFTDVVLRGDATASVMQDYCAHVRPAGLVPGVWYYYRFTAPDGLRSPVGRTRTLPHGSPDRFRIAVMSCSNATSGWFTAYDHAVDRDDIDLVVHLGDYIYESDLNRSDAVPGLAARRGIGPNHEAVTLTDYRTRYATYRQDAALRRLHRRYPIIVIRDDHETANNSWHGGAKNHDNHEGPWAARAAAGIRAHHEWLPMRRRDYAAYQIGDLATLFRLETRNLARTQQLDLETELAGARDPRAAVKAFLGRTLADPARTMMGATQERWLADRMSASVRSGTRWQVLAQQVILAPTRLPKVGDDWFAHGQVLSPRDRARLDLATQLAEAGLPLSLDRWDGYPAARARLLGAAQAANANLVTLSGDSHNGWAYNLDLDGRPAGVEFAGQAVSSLGLTKRFSGDPAIIAKDFIEANPGLQWCDTNRRGYMIVDIGQNSIANEWVFLNARDTQSPAQTGSHTLYVERGSNRLS